MRVSIPGNSRTVSTKPSPQTAHRADRSDLDIDSPVAGGLPAAAVDAGIEQDRTVLLAAVALAAGPRHWAVMRELVLGLGLRASDVPDAHLAALALERNAILATLDRGFARFPGLRLLDPTRGV